MGGFGFLDERGESGLVVDGHIGQDLAVELDPGFFQPADELAVRNLRGAAGCADTHDPQRPEIALLAAPSHESVAERFFDGFLGRAVQLALGEKKA